jgi:predicted nuclease of predicted toxin-antitoxin system
MTVVTHDLDFGALLSRSGLQSPSVVQIRADDLSVDALGAKLVAVLNDLAGELQTGALVTLDPVRVRYRVLPLRRQ